MEIKHSTEGQMGQRRNQNRYWITFGGERQYNKAYEIQLKQCLEV